MIDLFRAAASLQAQLDGLGLSNCIIGGLALQAWGELRLTRDADFTVLTNFEGEAEKASDILRLLTPRRPDALEFALRNRVLLGFIDGSTPVDIGLGGFDFERRVVSRAKTFEFAAGLRLRVCSAEDLVITKVFAGRDRDWTDVAGVLTRQGEAFDWKLVEEELPPLLELAEAPDRLRLLMAFRGGL